VDSTAQLITSVATLLSAIAGFVVVIRRQAQSSRESHEQTADVQRTVEERLDNVERRLNAIHNALENGGKR